MRLSCGAGAAFARGALLTFLAFLLGGCFDMEYQLSLRNDGGGAMRMQIVTDPALAGAFEGNSFAPGWTVRNFVREGRFFHEESQGFASVSALALKDESVRLQMSGLGAARQGALEHQVRLGPADPGAAALLTGRTLTYRIQLPGPVTTVEPVFIGGIEIEPVRQPAGATWRIPLPMFLRAGGQVVRFRAHFSAAGLALADSQSGSASSVGRAPTVPASASSGQQALTLKALAGHWVGSASSGAVFSWDIREDGTFDSVSSAARTSGKISLRDERMVWRNDGGASGGLLVEQAGASEILKGTVAGSLVTFELRRTPAAGTEVQRDQASPLASVLDSVPISEKYRVRVNGHEFFVVYPGSLPASFRDRVGSQLPTSPLVFDAKGVLADPDTAYKGLIANHVNRIMRGQSGVDDQRAEAEAQLLESEARQYASIVRETKIQAGVAAWRDIFIRLAVDRVSSVFNPTRPFMLPASVLKSFYKAVLKDPKLYIRAYLDNQLNTRGELLRGGAQAIRSTKGKPIDYETAGQILSAWILGMGIGSEAAMLRAEVEGDWSEQLEKSLATALDAAKDALPLGEAEGSLVDAGLSLRKLGGIFAAVEEYKQMRVREDEMTRQYEEIERQYRKFGTASASLASLQ